MKYLGDEFRDLVLKRTGLKPAELLCPREKSSMTPCIARDGNLAVGEVGAGAQVCVGCGQPVLELLEKERAKHVNQ